MNALPPLSRQSRYHFIDILRGWAVLVMIETHVVNAVMIPAIKLETPYKILVFINGLVAPTFLFCAGVAFAISYKRKWEEFIYFSPVARKYVLRLLFILFIAYSLHLPFFSLSKMLALTDPQAWASFFQVDILQTITVTLLFLTLLIVLARSQRLFIGFAVIVDIVIIFLAPIVREMDLSGLPVWVQPYLTLQVKSQFPLFPWSGFLISGMLLGSWFISANERGNAPRFMNRLALCAAGGIALSLLIENIPVMIYPHHDFWRASPEFFFVRAGVVVLLMYGLWWFDRKRKESKASMLTLFGQESLLVYVVHLLIVYGHTFEFSFVRLFGPTLNYAECFGLFAGLSIVMYIMAYLWHGLKASNKRYAQVIQYATVAAMIATFLLKQN